MMGEKGDNKKNVEPEKRRGKEVWDAEITKNKVS